MFALVEGLPIDAPLWREEHSRNESWTITNELQATHLEITDAWSRLIFAANGGKPKGKPLQVTRPDHITAARATAAEKRDRVKSLDDMARIASFFGRTGKV